MTPCFPAMRATSSSVGIGPSPRYTSTSHSCSSSATTADGSRRVIKTGGLRGMMRGFVASGARQMTVQQVASTSLAQHPRHPQPDSLRMLGASQSSRPSPSWTSGSSASAARCVSGGFRGRQRIHRSPVRRYWPIRAPAYVTKTGDAWLLITNEIRALRFRHDRIPSRSWPTGWASRVRRGTRSRATSTRRRSRSRSESRGYSGLPGADVSYGDAASPG